MLQLPAQLYACPYCNKTRPMLSLSSGNTIRGELWSDGREIYPMLPHISVIQKCPHCGEYSLFEQWKNTGKTDKSFLGETGELSYLEAKEAYKELINHSLCNHKICQIALYFIHAYNDEFRRPRLRKAIYEKKPISQISGYFISPKDDDKALFFDACQYLINSSDTSIDARILKAELYRELGEWTEAHNILHNLKADDKQWIADSILYYTCIRETSILPLVVDGKKIDYKTISIPEDPEVIKDRHKKLLAFIENLPIRLKKDIYTDFLGGVYDNRSKTLLKLITPSRKRYDVDSETIHIGDYAMYCNTDINQIKLSANIKSIGTKAFYGCTELTDMWVPDSNINVIGDCAFMNCKSLKVVNFIDNVKYIGRSAFSGMDKLGLVRLPEGIEYIPEFLFFECSYLEIVNIPKSVRKIESFSFQHTWISHLYLHDNILELGDAVFSRCFRLTYVRLPKFLKHIPERTFQDCGNISEIEIPKNVESIGKKAFEGTTSLKYIRFKGKVKRISASAIENSSVDTIIVPWYLKNYYKQLFPQLNIKLTF